MQPIKLIRTKYFGPSNFRGARIKAFDDNGNMIVLPWRDTMGELYNARDAVDALIDKHGLRLKVEGYGQFGGEYFFTVKHSEGN